MLTDAQIEPDGGEDDEELQSTQCEAAEDHEEVTKLHQLIRQSFTVSQPAAYTLISFDYSQMEMRLIAQLSGDKHLTALFSNLSCDVYRELASMCFSKPIGDITSRDRDIAKAVSLALIYGMGSAHMAAKLKAVDPNMTKPRCELIMDRWFKQVSDRHDSISDSTNGFTNKVYAIRDNVHQFPDVKKFLRLTKDAAKSRRDSGYYVRSITGRVREVGDIESSNGERRSYAERQATNFVIQGSASDMVKSAMIRILAGISLDERLQKSAAASDGSPEMPMHTATGVCVTFQHPTARILMQIHDEIVMEVRQDLVSHVITIVRPAMSAVLRGAAVQFPVNVHVGQRLGQMDAIIKTGQYKRLDADGEIVLTQNSVNVSQQSELSEDSVNRRCTTPVLNAMNQYQIDVRNYTP